MKIVKIIARWLFIICVPGLLLTVSISGAMNCRWLYQYGFNKYDISQVTGLTPVKLDEAAEGLIQYFNSGDEYINLTVIKDGQPFTLFNEREVSHLKDVKGLFSLNYKVLLGTGIYTLLYFGVVFFWWREKRGLGWGLFYGGTLTLVFMAAVGILIVWDFDRFFLQFHLFSFANDLWQLNPLTDYLIMLFPQGFWFDATLFVAGGTAALAIILGGLGWWLKRKYKDI